MEYRFPNEKLDDLLGWVQRNVQTSHDLSDGIRCLKAGIERANASLEPEPTPEPEVAKVPKSKAKP